MLFNVGKRKYSTFSGIKNIIESESDKNNNLHALQKLDGYSKETIYFNYSPIFNKLKEIISLLNGKNNKNVVRN